MKFAIPVSCFKAMTDILRRSAENIGLNDQEAKELTDQYSKDLFAAFPQSGKADGKFNTKEQVIIFSDEEMKPKENPFAARAEAAEADAVAAAEALEGMA